MQLHARNCSDKLSGKTQFQFKIISEPLYDKNRTKPLIVMISLVCRQGVSVIVRYKTPRRSDLLE